MVIEDPIRTVPSFQPWSSLPVNYDPELFRAEIRASANSERVRWFKARISPNYSKQSGTSSGPRPRVYQYIEQTVLREVRAKIGDERVVKNFVQAGAIDSGMIAVTVMPDELPLADDDLIIPIGRNDFTYPFPDARVFPFHDELTRGQNKVKLAGTISSTSIVVSGTGTSFLTDLHSGDVIEVGNSGSIVDTVTSDTSLALTSTPPCAYSNQSYSVAREYVGKFPMAYVDEVIDSNNVVYDPTTDFNISSDGRYIEWTNSHRTPAYGIVYRVRCYYYPIYILLPDYGTRRHVVNGIPMPMTLIARLATPQEYNSLIC